MAETPKPQITQAPYPLSEETIEAACGMIRQVPDLERVDQAARSVLDQMVAAGAAQPAATGTAADQTGTIR
jgi:hypothetical protein